MTDRKRHPWPHEELADDFTHAVCGDSYSSVDTRFVGVGQPTVATVTAYEVAEVVRWHVSYHGTTWRPGADTGTELSLHAVLRLKSGLWASVVAGNDYTGWGCQDHADVRLGETQNDVVEHGLDVEGRSVLGYAGGGS
jgi:hypothetical protein